MSFATLLDAVNQAEVEVGLTPSISVAGSTIPQARQMFVLANASGRQLHKEHEWSALQALFTFTTVANQSDYSAPVDYDRMISETHWDRSTLWPINGPITPQTDRALREGPFAWPSNKRLFRQIGGLSGNNIRIFPTPTNSGDTLVYEYISTYWAASSGSSLQTQFLADTDITLFPLDLLVKDIKWRYMAAKGMGTAAALKIERDNRLSEEIARDLGGEVLEMGDRYSGTVGWAASASSTPGNTIFTPWE